MAGWIAAGASLIGDVMSQQGQQSANSGQMAFNAQQAQLNRNFQQQETLQVEGWEQQNSDTAMQRRVTDLKAAGLNPLLAISQGGASQPSVGVPSGSSASASPQNPNAAFSNLGSQVANAEQTQAQVSLQAAQTDAANAQAKLTKSQTPSGIDDDGTSMPTVTVGTNHELGDANVANIQAQTGLAQTQTKQVAASVNLVNANIKNADADTALKNNQAYLATLNGTVLNATKQALIQQQVALGAAANNVGSVESGPLGQLITYINMLLHPINTASQAAGRFAQ